MGARINNNEKSRSGGDVNDYWCFELRDLLKSACFIDGQARSRTAPTGESLVVDLTSQSHPYLRTEFPCPDGIKTQTIRLTWRPTQFGGKRWYFIDEAGRGCEKLYLIGDRFVSRQAARLTYRSQSVGDLDRLLYRKDKLEARLEGSRGRGPARGRVRQKLLAELEQIHAGVEAIGGAIARGAVGFRARQRARRDASKQRLETAAKAMRNRREVSAAQVVERFTPLIDRLKQQERQREAGDDASPLPESEERAHVDIVTLARLGYLKEGQLRGDQLGWPEDWLAEPGRRLFFLVDAREHEHMCALFILEDGDRLEHQFFWLTRVEGVFGRQEYRFVCPPDDALSRTLLYEAGRFVCPKRPEPVEHLKRCSTLMSPSLVQCSRRQRTKARRLSPC